MSASDSTAEKNNNGRNPVILLSGSILIGLAVALILFGGPLRDLSRSETDAPALPQVPDLRETGSGQVGLTNNRLLEVGDTPHNFVLEDLDGKSYDLHALRGRPLVLNFWATWCAPCRVEMPELQAAFERHRDDGLLILAIDYDESADTVRRFFYDELALSFIPLLDEGGRVTEQYGVFTFPSTYFINEEGMVASIHRGPMVQEQIENYLATIIPSQE